MANEQSRRQGERQGEREPGAMARTGGGERGLATRQYQDPFTLFDSLFERMQRDFFGTSLLNMLMPGRGAENEMGPVARVPRVQMRDTGNALELTAEMPGIDGQNVSVQIEDNVLTITGEQRGEEPSDQARTERYISFYRQIPLPDGIDAEQAQASYRNGMLTIRFSKTGPRSNARQIPVETEPGVEQPAGQKPIGQQQTKERAA
jgi:HSP20 family molecular chaperone IbpA